MTDTATTTDIEFLDDLPPIRHSRKREAVYTAVATAAKGHPGKWVKLSADLLQTSIVKTIRDGGWEEFPAGQFDAASRNNDEKGKGTIYIKYIGATEA